MSAVLARLSREALELSPDERMQLVEAVLASLDSHAEGSDLSPEEKKRLGELWDEGIASGPGENLSMVELIEKARSSLHRN
jgi:putative addiction module component (TIGR02574 family)